MGYEVLDGSRSSGRRAEPADGLPAADVEVVDLADDSGRPDAAPAAPPRRVPVLPRAHRSTAIVAFALVVGLLAGLWLGRNKPTSGPDTAATSRLAVLATGDDVSLMQIDPGSGTAVARLEIRVLNLGSGAVSVVATPTTGNAPSPGQTVTFLPPSASIGPGQVQRVAATVSLDCQDPMDVVPALTVRTDDGTEHAVPVKDAQLAELHVTAAQVCGEPTSKQGSLDATVAGSVTSPVLVLANRSDRALRIVVSSASALRPPPGQVLADVNSGELVAAQAATESGVKARVTTRPAIPLTLPAGGTIRIAVRLSVQTCLSPPVLTGSGGLALAGLPVGADTVSNWTSGYVDLGPSLGAVVARTCERDGAPAR